MDVVNVKNGLRRKPILTGAALVLLVLFSVNVFLRSTRSIFALVPVNTLIAKTYFWNLVTCSFLETNIFKLLIDLVGICHLAVDLEYDSLDSFALYIGACLLFCSFSATVFCFIRFFMTSDDLFLVSPVYGFSGIYFSMLNFTRRNKSYAPVVGAYPVVTYQNLAFWVYLIQMVLRLVGVEGLSRDFYFSTAAIPFSWAYLSFVYKDNEGNVGTKSEEFKFVNMFPLVLHPIVVPLSTAFYNVFVLIGLFPALEVEKKMSQHHLRSFDGLK